MKKGIIYKVTDTVADKKNKERSAWFYCKGEDGSTPKFSRDEINNRIKAGDTFIGYRLNIIGNLIYDRRKILTRDTRRVTAQPFCMSEQTTKGYRVYTGTELRVLVQQFIAGRTPRYAVAQILKCLTNWEAGKICIVKGIRRTGKTVAILQAIGTLLEQGERDSDIGYVIITKEADANEVAQFVKTTPLQYVFIDEITYLNELFSHLKLMADGDSAFKKIVLTGTDSYVWPLAATDVLYGRQTPIDLTYMSFKEYSDVFPNRVKSGRSDDDIDGKREDVERFCRFGGVLDEREYAGLENAYISLQTALVANIVNTIQRNKNHPAIKAHAGELYQASGEQLTEALICAVLEASMTQRDDIFKTKQVKIPELASGILEKQGVFVSSGVNGAVVKRLTTALIELNVLDRIDNFAKPSNVVNPHGKMELTCHISSLYNTIVGAIDTELPLTGAAFENLILSQCIQFAKTMTQGCIAAGRIEDVVVGYCCYDVDQVYMGKIGEENKTPEIDLVVRHRSSSSVLSSCAIEVKKSKDPKSAHAKNFFLPSMAEALGHIDRYIVVYTGKTVKIREVWYVNAYDFLMDIQSWVLKS